MRAYFDETGHSSAGNFVGLGGLVGFPLAWDGFDKAWKSALVEHGVPHFHAREFAHSVGPFAGWKGEEDRRRKLLEQLMAAVRVAKLAVVGAVVDVDAAGQLPAELRSRMRDPYYHCFQTVARGAAIQAMHEPEGCTVDMVFATQGEYASGAKALWDVMKGFIDYRARMGELRFGEPTQEPGLQGADWLAYETNLEFGRLLGKKQRSQRWPFREFWKLSGNVPPMLRFFDAAELQAIYSGPAQGA